MSDQPNAPDVHSIRDLISLANRRIRYRNLNCECLWKILPQLIELDHMIGMEQLKRTVFHQIIYYLQDLWK